jgi:predicted P-loop ATPase
MLRTVFSLGAKHLSETELTQLASLCKLAGKLHNVTAPAINAELKRAQRIIQSRARRARLKARSALMAEKIDLTAVGEDSESRVLQTVVAVRDKVGADLRLNLLRNEIEFQGKAVDPNTQNIFIAYLLDEDVPDSICSAVLRVIAEKNSYHSVQEWLEQIHQQYGNSTLDKLQGISTKLLKTTNPLYDIYMRKQMIAAVARIYEPGCKVDSAVVLQGLQKLLKSTFWQCLAGSAWFDDNLGDGIGDPDQVALLHRTWFEEWGEIDRITGRKEMGAIKSFMSRQRDRFRAPYDRAAVEHPRQSVIVASVNPSEFLVDDENRRFWVIPVSERIDIAAVNDEREQLWAAAVAAYKSGETWWLTDEEENLAAESNEGYRKIHPWHSPIEEWLTDNSNLMVRGISDMNDWITSTKIMAECLGIDIKNHKPSDRTVVDTILKSLGWIKAPKQIRLLACKKPQRAWFRPVAVPNVTPAEVLAPEQSQTQAISQLEPTAPTETDDVTWDYEITDEQLEPVAQGLELGEWSIDEPTIVPEPQQIVTHRAVGDMAA